MKTKKTLKRLNKVVALLSDVIDQLPGSQDGLGDLLDSAKGNVVRAAKMVHSQPSKGAGKPKPPTKTEKAGQGRVSAASKKRISVAVKKGSDAAKRKDIGSATGRGLSQTA